METPTTTTTTTHSQCEKRKHGRRDHGGAYARHERRDGRGGGGGAIRVTGGRAAVRGRVTRLAGLHHDEASGDGEGKVRVSR